MAGAGQIPGAGNADDATTEDENLHGVAPGKYPVNLPLGDIAILWQVIWADFSFILSVPVIGTAVCYDLLQSAHLLNIKDLYFISIGFGATYFPFDVLKISLILPVILR